MSILSEKLKGIVNVLDEIESNVNRLDKEITNSPIEGLIVDNTRRMLNDIYEEIGKLLCDGVTDTECYLRNKTILKDNGTATC